MRVFPQPVVCLETPACQDRISLVAQWRTDLIEVFLGPADEAAVWE